MMAPSRHQPYTIPLFIATFLSFLALASALNSTSTSAAPPSTTSSTGAATIVPSTALYTYYGCYNETTADAAAGNVRALAGGNMTSSDSMTVAYCLSFCGSNMFAGLEYGRECWCAQYLNINSGKLPDASCNDPCAADSTEVCGGSLTLTLYQHKNATSTSGAAGVVLGGLVCTVSSLAILGALFA